MLTSTQLGAMTRAAFASKSAGRIVEFVAKPGRKVTKVKISALRVSLGWMLSIWRRNESLEGRLTPLQSNVIQMPSWLVRTKTIVKVYGLHIDTAGVAKGYPSQETRRQKSDRLPLWILRKSVAQTKTHAHKGDRNQIRCPTGQVFPSNLATMRTTLILCPPERAWPLPDLFSEVGKTW